MLANKDENGIKVNEAGISWSSRCKLTTCEYKELDARRTFFVILLTGLGVQMRCCVGATLCSELLFSVAGAESRVEGLFVSR